MIEKNKILGGGGVDSYLSTSNNKINCESKNNKKTNSQNATKDLIEIKKENCSNLQSTKFNNEHIVNYKERVYKNSCKYFLCCNSAKANKTKTLNPNSIKNYFNNKSNTYAISNKFVVKSTIMFLLWLFVFIMSLTMLCYFNNSNGNKLNTTMAVDAIEDTGEAVDFRENGGDGSINNPYIIKSPMNLRYLSINQTMENTTGEPFLYASYKLIANINYTCKADVSAFDRWTPIGTTESSAFSGSFDGSGYTITFTQTIYIVDSSGVEMSDKVYGGLFGYVKSLENKTVNIKNLTINWSGNDIIEINNQNYTGLVVEQTYLSYFQVYAGGIVGFIKNELISPILISNCNSAGNINGLFSSYKSASLIAYVGGIVGKAEVESSGEIIISRCKNLSMVRSANAVKSYVGGIVGVSSSSNSVVSECCNIGEIQVNNIFECYAGGITGSDGTINDCYNTGDVSHATYAGGISGECYYGEITNCYNEGDITTNNDRETYAGGIVGFCYDKTINNCYNKGNIISYRNTGGISGYGGIINNCYNLGKVVANANGYYSTAAGGIAGSAATVTNCFSLGIAPTATASGSNAIAYKSGIVGEEGSVSYSYHNYGSSYGNVSGTTINRSDLATKVKSQNGLLSLTWNSSYSWDFASIWGINSNVNESYPYLKYIEECYVTYKVITDSVSEEKTINYGLKNDLSSETILSVSDSGLTMPLGKIFSHWEDEFGNIYKVGYSFQLSSNLVLTAIWSEFVDIAFDVTTNVGVIFNICDSDSNILQSIYVTTGSSFTDTIPTFTYNALIGQSYKVLISTPYTSAIQHTNVEGQQNLVGRVLYLTVNEEFTVTMNISGYLGGNSIVV